MLQLVDDAIERLLRDAVPLDPADVDVTFAVPDRDQAGAQPAVNLVLWSVHRSARNPGSGVDVVEIDGRPHRRPALPVVDCHYLVSAWATEARDEHHLLGAVLAVLLEHDDLGIDGATIAVGHDVPQHASELLSAAGHPMKAAVELVVTVPVDAAAVRAAGPPVTRYTARVTDGRATSERSVG